MNERTGWKALLRPLVLTMISAVATAFVVAMAQRLILGHTYYGLTTGAAIAAALVVSRVSTGAWRVRR